MDHTNSMCTCSSPNKNEVQLAGSTCKNFCGTIVSESRGSKGAVAAGFSKCTSCSEEPSEGGYWPISPKTASWDIGIGCQEFLQFFDSILLDLPWNQAALCYRPVVAVLSRNACVLPSTGLTIYLRKRLPNKPNVVFPPVAIGVTFCFGSGGGEGDRLPTTRAHSSRVSTFPFQKAHARS